MIIISHFLQLFNHFKKRIALYIQSELQRSEDPEASAVALSVFERHLSEIMGRRGARQARVRDVMGGLK